MKYIFFILSLTAHLSLSAKTAPEAPADDINAILSAIETPRVVRPAKVDYDDFKTLVTEVESHRESRLIDLNTFLKMSKEPDVVILDSATSFLKFRHERT